MGSLVRVSRRGGGGYTVNPKRKVSEEHFERAAELTGCPLNERLTWDEARRYAAAMGQRIVQLQRGEIE